MPKGLGVREKGTERLLKKNNTQLAGSLDVNPFNSATENNQQDVTYHLTKACTPTTHAQVISGVFRCSNACSTVKQSHAE